MLGYINRFREAVIDLDNAGKPMDGTMQKSMFLSKIDDKDYVNIKDQCLDDPTFTIHDYISKMETKFQRLAPLPNKSRS